MIKFKKMFDNATAPNKLMTLSMICLLTTSVSGCAGSKKPEIKPEVRPEKSVSCEVLPKTPKGIETLTDEWVDFDLKYSCLVARICHGKVLDDCSE